MTIFYTVTEFEFVKKSYNYIVHKWISDRNIRFLISALLTCTSTISYKYVNDFENTLM